MNEIVGHLLTVILAIAPCIGISIAYFVAGRSKALPERIIKSSHGIFLVFAFYFSVYAARFTVNADPKPWETAFYILLALAAISAILSFIKYVSWKWHLLYLVEIPIGFLIWIWGGLIIWHDSL